MPSKRRPPPPNVDLPAFMRERLKPMSEVEPMPDEPITDLPGIPEPTADYAGPGDATPIIPPDPPTTAVFEDLPPVPADTFTPLGDVAAAVVEKAKPTKMVDPPKRPPPLAIGVTKKYVQRVEVMDVYQFNADVGHAPDWVDRNWIAYETNTIQGREPGPTLVIPDVGTVRRGDFVVRQQMLMEGGAAKTVRVAIYTPEQFVNFFIQVDEQAPKAPVPEVPDRKK